MSELDKAETLVGEHSRETYVRLLAQLVGCGFSGLLSVAFGSHKRDIGLLRGRPAYYSSNLVEDDLRRTLVQSHLIPEKRMKWLEDKMDEAETLEEVVLLTGTLTNEELANHLFDRIRTGIGAPLRWGKGTWQVRPLETVGATPVDPRLLPSLDGFGGLWQGVLSQVSVDEVFPLLSTSEGVEFRPAGGFMDLFGGLDIDPPLDRLPEVLGSGATTDAIFKEILDATGTLPKLLWFLEVAGVLERDPGATEKLHALREILRGLSDQFQWQAQESPSSERVTPVLVEVQELDQVDEELEPVDLEQSSDAGIGEPELDLSEEQPENEESLEVSAEEPEAEEVVEAPPEEQEAEVAVAAGGGDSNLDATENGPSIGTAIAEVVEVFEEESEDEAVYASEQAERGTDGLELHEEGVEAGSAEAARAFIENGHFEEAIPVLEQILDERHGFSEANLRANRETPGLLSDLAWCLWRSRGGSSEPGADAYRDEAEALIGKALELNAKHLPTLVYRARMALEVEDRKNSIVFLKRILVIEPDHDWAQAYLAEQEDEPKPRGLFGLFKGRSR